MERPIMRKKLSRGDLKPVARDGEVRGRDPASAAEQTWFDLRLKVRSYLRQYRFTNNFYFTAWEEFSSHLGFLKGDRSRMFGTVVPVRRACKALPVAPTLPKPSFNSDLSHSYSSSNGSYREKNVGIIANRETESIPSGLAWDRCFLSISIDF
jgi:hypothetical protein